MWYSEIVDYLLMYKSCTLTTNMFKDGHILTCICSFVYCMLSMLIYYCRKSVFGNMHFFFADYQKCFSTLLLIHCTSNDTLYLFVQHIAQFDSNNTNMVEVKFLSQKYLIVKIYSVKVSCFFCRISFEFQFGHKYPPHDSPLISLH